VGLSQGGGNFIVFPIEQSFRFVFCALQSRGRNNSFAASQEALP
jgi:hypothetical protein